MTWCPIVHYSLWKGRAPYRRLISHAGGAASYRMQRAPVQSSRGSAECVLLRPSGEAPLSLRPQNA